MQPSYVEAENGGGAQNPVKPGKSDSIHYINLPAFDTSRMNQDAVDAMETLQKVIELGRIIREKRLINLKTPVKNLVVIMASPTENVIKAITGPLKSYILSELNAWELTVISKEEEHKWVKLSLTPDFKKLGKKFGKKMKTVASTIKGMSHAEAVAVVEKGSLDIEGQTVDALTEMVSKLSFSQEGEQWEPASTEEGDYVVAVDCTQDEKILAAGRARELMNAIQQLRKNAGLELKDKVEAFFSENETDPLTELAVSSNVDAFKAKFKGSVPVPFRFAPEWSVVIAKEEVEIAGAKVEVTICRPAVAAKNGISDEKATFLTALDPSSVQAGSELSFTLDGTELKVKEGEDFWLNTAAKLAATKAVDWL